MKPKVIVIAGPTASGKTGLSIEVAKRLNGEVVSADSMQVYKDMNIGTAKVTKEGAQGIKHYLIDVVSPDERYTVSNFNKDALEAIEKILAEGKTPIVVGGTGLYIDSLIYGIEYQEMKFDIAIKYEQRSFSETFYDSLCDNVKTINLFCVSDTFNFSASVTIFSSFL